MPQDSGVRFEPPGPGTWFLDPTHWTKPVTRFFAELAPGSMVQGFREGFRRYGVLLDYLDWAFVNGFPYWSPRPLGAPPGATGHPPREVWEALMGTDAEIKERLRTSDTVFDRKVWRDDLRRWDEEKPASVEAHRKLLAVDPSTLPGNSLLAHLDDCREHLRRNIYALHTLTMASIVPVGDLMAQGQEWSGRPAGELLSLLEGAAPLSRGPREELDRLATAISADRQARALLDGPDPAEVLTSLRSLPGEVGAAVSGYLDVVAHQPVNGHDVGEPCGIELPGLLVEAIRGAATGVAGVPDDARTAERIARVRADVADRHRAAFDELLAEARLVSRVRDERYLLTTHWAEGIARRAILAAGDVLAGQGRLDDPKLLIEADYAEMRALLEGWEGPSSGELRRRARYRAEARFTDAPAVLGPPPGPPLPTDWLPPIPARLQRAVLTAIDAVIGTPAPSGNAGVVRGLAAGEGVVEGPARLVLGSDDFDRVRPGDVLITSCTTPAFTVVLPLLAGIVTDAGGLLSHAAIVARELGIPAVVGCTNATSRIPDGALVRVDARAGEAVVLSRPQGP